MSAPLAFNEVEIRHGHLFCGLGGGAKGFNRAVPQLGNLKGRFRCVGGIDVDPAAVRDFTRAAGVAGTVMDLFDREQYVEWHGKEPAAAWRPMGPDDIRRAFGNERPHIAFTSPPCKGLSGLLSESKSKTQKYQALNRLTVRGIWLLLEAYKDDPIEFILLENVPRIATRGRHLLDQINALLKSYGYIVAETTHDCGQLGGLAQSRKRFLLVARHRVKVPPFLYEPPKRKLRGVGEILGKMLLPGDLRAGPMHRVPGLQFQTWVRLAFVEAGSDWRSLNKLAVEDGQLKDFLLVPDMHGGVLGVKDWDEPSCTIAGRSSPTNNAYSVADPRFEGYGDSGIADARGQLGVKQWDQPANTVTGARSPIQGGFSVADPRFEQSDKWKDGQQYGVNEWTEPTGAIGGQQMPGQGRYAVSDPREGISTSKQNNCFRIVRWSEASGAITAGTGPSAGGLSVADPRAVGGREGGGKYAVTSFDNPAGTIIAGSTTGQGACAVADPRMVERRSAALGVLDWSEPAGTVGGESLPSNGTYAVADPRTNGSEVDTGKYKITGWDQNSGTVIAGGDHGAYGVSDPRLGWDAESAHGSKLEVLPYDKPSKTVTASRFGSGALCVADPRPGLAHDRAYLSGGHYGVVPWDRPAGAISQAKQCHCGPWSVADTRLPQATDRGIVVIRALDGTWHRPFTTLELAALQSLVDPEEQMALDGLNDQQWRERIGNAVPPGAAQAIGETMGLTLMLAWQGEGFQLSSLPIWCRSMAIAAAVNIPDLPVPETI